MWLQAEQIVSVRRQVFGFDELHRKVLRSPLPMPESLEERELSSAALVTTRPDAVVQVPAGVGECQWPAGEVEEKQQKRVDHNQNTEFG